MMQMMTIPDESREKLWGWYNIAMEFDVHEATAKRWCREEPEFRRIIRRFRNRVFAYRDEVRQCRRAMETTWRPAKRTQ